MSTSPTPTPPPENHDGSSAWVRPVAVILSCLVLGFVGGWLLRGDDGEVTVLAPVADGGAPLGTTPDGPAGTGTAGADGTTGIAGTVPGETTGSVPGETTETAAEPAEAPERGEVALAVLNGTSVAGLAASTAERAATLGYSGVVTGNAPTTSDPSVVYHRPGARPAAEQAATDLEIVTVRPLPRSGAIAEAAPSDARVIVVLGSG